MFSRLLFGVNNSPERKICVVLAVALTLIGFIIIPVQGSRQGMIGVIEGILFVLLGLVTVAIISRQFAARDEKQQTHDQLEKINEDFDHAALPDVVDHAPKDPNEQMKRVTAQLDVTAIRAAVEQVREKSAEE